MNVEASSFSNLASKKRKLWQYVAGEVASGKRSNGAIANFIGSVWHISRSRNRQGGRKTIRFHDLWHILNGDDDEIEEPSNPDAMVDYC